MGKIRKLKEVTLGVTYTQYTYQYIVVGTLYTFLYNNPCGVVREWYMYIERTTNKYVFEERFILYERPKVLS